MEEFVVGNTMRVESVPVNGSTERLFQLKKGGNHKRTLSLDLEKSRLESILEEEEGDHRPVTQSQSLPILKVEEDDYVSEVKINGIPVEYDNRLGCFVEIGLTSRAATPVAYDVWGAFKEWLMTCGGMCRD